MEDEWTGHRARKIARQYWHATWQYSNECLMQWRGTPDLLLEIKVDESDQHDYNPHHLLSFHRTPRYAPCYVGEMIVIFSAIAPPARPALDVLDYFLDMIS